MKSEPESVKRGDLLLSDYRRRNSGYLVLRMDGDILDYYLTKDVNGETKIITDFNVYDFIRPMTEETIFLAS